MGGSFPSNGGSELLGLLVTLGPSCALCTHQTIQTGSSHEAFRDRHRIGSCTGWCFGTSLHVQLGRQRAAELQQYYGLKGATFSDTINFSLTGLSDLEVGAVSNIFGSFGITSGLVSVSKGATLLDSFAVTGSTNSAMYSSLGAGDYSIVISGTVSGKSGGNYLLNAAVTPVPEPETYALMLAGLGAVAFIARRRKSV